MRLPDDIALRVALRADAAPLPTDALSAEERERLAGYHRPKRQREFTLGRAVTRALLADRLGGDPAAIPLEVADDGAPEVRGDSLHVSIAHTATGTATVAAAAVGRRRLGVDVEAIRPLRDGIERFFLRPDEKPLVEQLPEGSALVVLWALKEAVLKAERTGFQTSPMKLRLVLDGPGNAAATVEEGGGWTLRWAERAGCIVVVAFEE